MARTSVHTLQTIRLLDVFLIGPLMIYTSLKADTVPAIPRLLLGFVGIGSMIFNGTNYMRDR